MDKVRITSQLSALLLTGGFTVSAGAVSVDLTAVFRPDPAKPMHNEFKNTTPQGGYCKDHPAYCANGIFSIALPIRFRSIAPILPEHAERQGAMFRTPSYWKEVTVIHDGSGKAETLKMRVNGIGAAYTIKEALPVGVWDASWVNAPAPCSYGGVGYGTAYYYAFFWRVPANAGICAKRAYQPIPETLGFAYQDVGFSYELVTPDPLKMSTGTYRGVMNYTVGPQQDFDMGDVMLPDDDLINLNFTLTVEHTLKVDIPPGGDRVELVPEGGWQSWLTQGRKPTRLFRDQTFTVASSSRFKMRLECQYTQDGDNCSLREPVSGHVVPLNVSVTLPSGLTDATGRPVHRQPLRRNGSGSELFVPGFYVDRKPGTLHFEIPASEVAEMIRPERQRQYSGSVTVIWDSEVG